MWISNRWLNARTQFIGALVSGGVAYLVVNEAHTLGSTIAGLALVYAINFTEQLTFLSRAHSDVQIDMNSVERIKEYCSVDQEKYEPDATTTTTTTGTIVHSPVVKRPGTDVLPRDWPSKGEIRFENICMRYREGIPPVLK
jgi:ABC-type multidrug transport system fused ATPase/permease subunit